MNLYVISTLSIIFVIYAIWQQKRYNKNNAQWESDYTDLWLWTDNAIRSRDNQIETLQATIESLRLAIPDGFDPYQDIYDIEPLPGFTIKTRTEQRVKDTESGTYAIVPKLKKSDDKTGKKNGKKSDSKNGNKTGKKSDDKTGKKSDDKTSATHDLKTIVSDIESRENIRLTSEGIERITNWLNRDKCPTNYNDALNRFADNITTDSRWYAMVESGK